MRPQRAEQYVGVWDFLLWDFLLGVWDFLHVLLSLHTSDRKRLATTTDWPKFLAREWPKHRQAVAKKFPAVLWR